QDGERFVLLLLDRIGRRGKDDRRSRLHHKAVDQGGDFAAGAGGERGRAHGGERRDGEIHGRGGGAGDLRTADGDAIAEGEDRAAVPMGVLADERDRQGGSTLQAGVGRDRHQGRQTRRNVEEAAVIHFGAGGC